MAARGEHKKQIQVKSSLTDAISMYTSKFAEERELRTQRRLELIRQQEERDEQAEAAGDEPLSDQ